MATTTAARRLRAGRASLGQRAAWTRVGRRSGSARVARGSGATRATLDRSGAACARRRSGSPRVARGSGAAWAARARVGRRSGSAPCEFAQASCRPLASLLCLLVASIWCCPSGVRAARKPRAARAAPDPRASCARAASERASAARVPPDPRADGALPERRPTRTQAAREQRPSGRRGTARAVPEWRHNNGRATISTRQFRQKTLGHPRAAWRAGGHRWALRTTRSHRDDEKRGPIQVHPLSHLGADTQPRWQHGPQR